MTFSFGFKSLWRQGEGFSWLERGKPLGFLSPRVQLSLGEGRRLKKKRKI